ncbi:MAG: hypothetical protein J6X14_02490 [Lachnospiraceae bacterium]|nr:hypothetical protein [Lachnospiraceae bacterium]MBP5669158.1 hypothetical protein [Lachnospiraceae bacterium]MBP5732354.1 hypothetical protein [Lachnospiraceae bacterium]
MEYLLFGIVLAFFAKATAEDVKCKQVHRYLWGFAAMAGVLLLLLCQGRDLQVVWDLLIFAALQYLLFSRMYGMADCHAFVTSAILLSAYGGTILIYLIHMLLTIVFLGVVQFFCGNVNRHGNLHRPVAMLPYILAAFLAVWFFLIDIK